MRKLSNHVLNVVISFDLALACLESGRFFVT